MTTPNTCETCKKEKCANFAFGKKCKDENDDTKCHGDCEISKKCEWCNLDCHCVPKNDHTCECGGHGHSPLVPEKRCDGSGLIGRRKGIVGSLACRGCPACRPDGEVKLPDVCKDCGGEKRDKCNGNPCTCSGSVVCSCLPATPQGKPWEEEFYKEFKGELWIDKNEGEYYGTGELLVAFITKVADEAEARGREQMLSEKCLCVEGKRCWFHNALFNEYARAEQAGLAKGRAEKDGLREAIEKKRNGCSLDDGDCSTCIFDDGIDQALAAFDKARNDQETI